MRSGKLRNRASIERIGASSLDDFGNPLPGSFDELVSARPCSIMVMTGREQDIGARPQSVVTFRCVFRHTAVMKAVNAGDVLVLSRASADLEAGARLNIMYDPIDPTGRRDHLEFTASHGDAAG